MSCAEPRTRRDSPFLWALGAWFLLYFAARLALKWLELPAWGRVLIALAPALPFVGVLWLGARVVRGLDELERRVHLEALALAYPLATLMLMILGLVQRAVPLAMDDWSYAHVWLYLPMLYSCGLAFAWKRYR